MKVYKFSASELAACEARKDNYLNQLMTGKNNDGKELSYHEVETLKKYVKKVNKKIGFQKYLRNLPNQELQSNG